MTKQSNLKISALGDEQKGQNADLVEQSARIIKGNTYKDLSTIIVIPTRGMINYKVVGSWRLLLPILY